jgi:hypothetical protein
MRQVLRISLLSLPAAALTISCGLLVTHDEVARTTSPSGDADAVLVESNGGATTSFWYDVYLVEPGAHWDAGEHVAYLYGAVRSSSAYGVNLRWTGPTSLTIGYLRADKARLEETSLRVAGKTRRIALRPGMVDNDAPPGGMLYNLEGRPHG